MTLDTLDNAFPFFVFGYGFIITAVLNSPLGAFAETRLPGWLGARMRSHRGLAFVCLIVGAAWSFQTLWLS